MESESDVRTMTDQHGRDVAGVFDMNLRFAGGKIVRHGGQPAENRR
jgi:hypothetical protein